MNNHRGLLAVVALAVADFACLMISGIPRYKDATGGVDWAVGAACWLGFLVGTLALVVIGAIALVRRVRATGDGQRIGR